jgi:hypothetical protein
MQEIKLIAGTDASVGTPSWHSAAGSSARAIQAIDMMNAYPVVPGTY